MIVRVRVRLSSLVLFKRLVVFSFLLLLLSLSNVYSTLFGLYLRPLATVLLPTPRRIFFRRHRRSRRRSRRRRRRRRPIAA